MNTQTPSVANGTENSGRDGLLATTALGTGQTTATLAADTPNGITRKPPFHLFICEMIGKIGEDMDDKNRLMVVTEIVENSDLKREHAAAMLTAADKRCVELQTKISAGDTMTDESLVTGLRTLSALLTQKLDAGVGRGIAEHPHGGGDTGIAERGPVHEAA
jgi:hypothetical protein